MPPNGLSQGGKTACRRRERSNALLAKVVRARTDVIYGRFEDGFFTKWLILTGIRLPPQATVWIPLDSGSATDLIPRFPPLIPNRYQIPELQ